MFKVGIVGCGGIGRAHANAWSAIEGVRVAAVADLNAERAQSVADLCGAKALTDLADLPEDLDAVSVVTPPSAHYPVVKALLERGFHVFCEKPLTMNVRKGRELERLAKEKGKQLGVGFKMRFEPIFRKAKELVPEIGDLVSIVTTKQQMYHPRPESTWVKDVGAMYELSVHDFDLITFLTGKVPGKVLFSRLDHHFGWEKEDGFAAVVDYGNGVTAQLQGMYAEKTCFCFRDLTITLLGEQGYLRIERPDRIVLHTDQFRVVEVDMSKEKSAFIQELEQFRDAVLGKSTNTLSAADAVRMTELIESIRAAGEHRDQGRI